MRLDRRVHIAVECPDPFAICGEVFLFDGNHFNGGRRESDGPGRGGRTTGG